MAKAKKPNEEALRTEARDRMRDMPAETAGGRLDEQAELDELDDERLMDDEGSIRDDLPLGDERAMRDKRGNQPNPRPKR